MLDDTWSLLLKKSPGHKTVKKFYYSYWISNKFDAWEMHYDEIKSIHLH